MEELYLFIGNNQVKYAHVSSGREGMTMVVRVTGDRNVHIQPPFMVFKNQQRKFSIRDVADCVREVSYRTGPYGWMDHDVFLQ